MHRLIQALDQRVRPAHLWGPRSAALEVLGRHGRRRTAAQLLFTLPYRDQPKAVMTVQSDASRAPNPGAARLKSELGPALVARDAPPASGRELLVLEVGCGREAPAIARAALRQIKELGAAHDDAILVGSELVTNAVLHSGGSPADTIQVRAVLMGRHVSISVHDPGLSGDTPHLRDTSVIQAEGRGLRIVERLACRWGFELDRGNRVWADLATGHGE
jgi:anti-sigma regulatory factor (Ser/Thr protein kinase)